MKEDKSDILVVLDIDETLLYATKNQLDNEHDFMVADYFVYLRPYFHSFIDFLTQNFPFAVWSSASDEYVNEIAEKTVLGENAEFCWARSKATFKKPSSYDSDGNFDVDASDHHYYLKRLKKVKKLGYDLEKILIIDDSPHKSKENYGNAIYISEFKGDKSDSELVHMMDYLMTLKYVENVREIEKRNWRLREH